MWWIGILKFKWLVFRFGRYFNGWCCSRVWYVQTCHGSKADFWPFCHSNLRSDIETSYENPTTETNYEYLLEVIFETTLICREGFSTAGHDPPCIPGPLVTSSAWRCQHSRPRQTQHSMALRPTELLIPIAWAWEADSLLCASGLSGMSRCVRALICGYRIH